MLAQNTQIDGRSRWSEAERTLQDDARFKAVPDSADREDLFNEFVEALTKKEKVGGWRRFGCVGRTVFCWARDFMLVPLESETLLLPLLSDLELPFFEHLSICKCRCCCCEDVAQEYMFKGRRSISRSPVVILWMIRPLPAGIG